MSMVLSVETDPPGKPLAPCPHTDSKEFHRTLFSDTLDKLGMFLGVDVGPLKHAHTPLDEQAVRDEWGEVAEAMLAEAAHHSALAWRSPATFVTCLNGLIERMDRHGGKLPEKLYAFVDPTGENRPYFQEGVFFADLSSCREAFLEAKARGARRARFVLF